VPQFIEKPDVETANKSNLSGYFWNSGMEGFHGKSNTIRSLVRGDTAAGVKMTVYNSAYCILAVINI